MSASRFASHGIIAFNTGLLTIPGVDHIAALFLSQCLFWQGVKDRRDGGGHWWKSAADWYAELLIARKQLARCRALWRDLGVLLEGRKGAFDSTMTYRIDMDRLDALLAEHAARRSGESPEDADDPDSELRAGSEGHNGASPEPRRGGSEGHLRGGSDGHHPLTENTSETTPEITSRKGAGSRRPNPPGVYAFTGRIIKLTWEHFNQWQSSFGALDLRSELQGLDDFYAETLKPHERPKWFIRCSGALARKNADRLAAARAPAPQERPRARQGWEIERDAYGQEAFFMARQQGMTQEEAGEIAREARAAWESDHPEHAGRAAV